MENVVATVAFEKIRGEITGARNEPLEQVTYWQKPGLEALDYKSLTMTAIDNYSIF